jgi:HK97 family phage prohead protease
MVKGFSGAVKQINEEARTVDFTFNSGQIDRDNEIIPASALQTDEFMRNPVFLWAHRYDEPSIGKVVQVGAEGDATIGTVQFANTEFAQDIFNLYKGGFLNAVSIGFRPSGWIRNQNNTRTLAAGKLLEVSGVPIPADPGAIRRRLKMLGMELPEAPAEAPVQKTLEIKADVPVVSRIVEVLESIDHNIKALLDKGPETKQMEEAAAWLSLKQNLGGK